MPKPFRPSAHELLIIMLVLAAAVTGIVFLVNDLRSPATDYCLTVDDAFAARIAEQGLTPIKAAAARDPWITNRQSEPYANYYVVAMRVTTADGATGEGLWGIGTNAPAPEEGVPLSFGEAETVITALDSLASQATAWPQLALPFEADGTPASRAQECLLD